MAKFQKGQSGNPKGRPPGSSPAADYRKLLDPHVPALIQRAVDLALSGDTTALRICLERVFPALKAIDAPIEIDGLSAAEGLTAQGNAIIAALAEGHISTSDAAHAMQSISQLARVTEIDELEQRVARLEAENGG